ncbi:MAG: prepilin-type N-terminal cleavage/methylation domain-containing protein [Kiritimatiellia bacterium]
MGSGEKQQGQACRKGGMTLVEVMLAVFILAVCLIGLLQGMAVSAQYFHASHFVQQAMNVLAKGDAAHPMAINEDPVSDLEVTPDGELLAGWTYERVCEEDEDEDGLYTVRTKVVQGHGGPGNEMEFLSLLYFPEGSSGGASGG